MNLAVTISTTVQTLCVLRAVLPRQLGSPLLFPPRNGASSASISVVDLKRVMAILTTPTDIRTAAPIVHRFGSPTPLIRSYPLEKHLGLSSSGRRVWLKDYGWSPVGSFKWMGAVYWLHQQLEKDVLKRGGSRPVAAHSSGNFASGIAFAGQQYNVPIKLVMPDVAPQVKFERTRALGAEIITYDKANDHMTGERDRLTAQITEEFGAIQASPYNHPDVIAGNGVGGLEIAAALKAEGRSLSHFFCQVSGGGLMAGHALAIADAFPGAEIIGVEPDGADDFRQSLRADHRVRIDQPTSICDGLLSYDVGEHNWPILRQHVTRVVSVADAETRRAMQWLYNQHGLRTEPSGAIATSPILTQSTPLDGKGDIVIVVSGRNVDEQDFQAWIRDI